MSQRGFTLVELSVVIVIIGLLVGGVMLGQHLIKAAELNAVVNDYELLRFGFVQFKTKYNALPGDFTRATSFWGTDPGGCPIAVANTVLKKETCNGDGSGTITSGITEFYRVWQHLADAGLIKGLYAGVIGPGTFPTVGGINVPAGRIAGSTYTVWYEGNSGGIQYPGNWGHVIAFSSLGNYAVLTAAEAKQIDLKADDGIAGSGNITGRGGSPTCMSSLSDPAATYNLALSGVNCALNFKTGF